MDRPAIEVADIFRRYGEVYRVQAGTALSSVHGRVMAAIERCRTAALGGHVEQCERCQYRRISYNSCRNRHCPKCQGLARAAWIEHRTAELLDTEYFHVVFTVPAAIAELAYYNKRVVYNILFRATAETLRTIAADPQHLGAAIGFFAVLHTWGQALQHHPHLHCVIPGGGPSTDGTQWVSARPGFFLPVRVLSRLFRRLFLKYLQTAFDGGRLQCVASLAPLAHRRAFAQYVASTQQTDWVVYAKRPFAGPRQVLDYVGRYTHRVAISNNRLVDLSDGKVRFQWKDYRNPEPHQKTMTLAASEFIRRFLLHVLPSGFQRIRYFGFLGNRQRAARLAQCRALLKMAPPDPLRVTPTAATDYRDRYEALTGVSLRVCPRCHDGRMTVVEYLVRTSCTPALINTS